MKIQQKTKSTFFVWAPRVAQSIKNMTLDFGSGQSMDGEIKSYFRLCTKHGACLRLSHFPSLSAPPSHTCTLSDSLSSLLSLKKKKSKIKKIK